MHLDGIDGITAVVGDMDGQGLPQPRKHDLDLAALAVRHRDRNSRYNICWRIGTGE